MAERRMARNGFMYTRSQFVEWYEDSEYEWDRAGIARPAVNDVPQLVDMHTDAAAPSINDAPEVVDVHTDTVATSTNDVLQLVDVHTDAAASSVDDVNDADTAGATPLLLLEHVVAIQNEEARLFRPPRSLHQLARDALRLIADSPTRDTVDNLGDYFPWRQYVAAHKDSATIIGPGITNAKAVFEQGRHDANRGGAARLDFWFYRSDDSVIRVHPGNKPKNDAKFLLYTVQDLSLIHI